MIDWLADPQAWIALGTLTALEIVLGVDNVIFISILASRLPRAIQEKARRTGLLGAFVLRLMLLFSISYIIRLVEPLFSVAGQELSGKDLVLLFGGLFLIAKSTREMHTALEGSEHDAPESGGGATFGGVVAQILVVDLVFSLDSVITAVGMVQEITIMITAVVISLGVMLLSARSIGEFVMRHPTVKMLALAFLLLIGVMLTAEAFDQKIPKGYIYFAMAFSVGVEMLNLRLRKEPREPVALRVPGTL